MFTQIDFTKNTNVGSDVERLLKLGYISSDWGDVSAKGRAEVEDIYALDNELYEYYRFVDKSIFRFLFFWMYEGCAISQFAGWDT